MPQVGALSRIGIRSEKKSVLETPLEVSLISYFKLVFG